MAQYVPPDWPAGVHPPGSEGWEGTAVTWLLDLVPEYRQYTLVCRHPVILASIARHLIRGSVEGARDRVPHCPHRARRACPAACG